MTFKTGKEVARKANEVAYSVIEEEIIPKPEIFKTTIERVSDGKIFFFYTNGYEQLIESEFFTNKNKDAKTLEEYCFSDMIKERFI